MRMNGLCQCRQNKGQKQEECVEHDLKSLGLKKALSRDRSMWRDLAIGETAKKCKDVKSVMRMSINDSCDWYVCWLHQLYDNILGCDEIFFQLFM